MAGTIDRRAARTRKALHGALISLILRKGYEAVTVRDIIDEADVGRSTFYAHYTGKEDLLRKGFQTLSARLADEQRNASAPGEPQTEALRFSRALFEHACEYKDVYRALIGGRGGIVATNEIRRVLGDVVRKELSVRYKGDTIPRDLVVQFVVETFLTVLGWSLKRKPPLPPTQMDDVFRQLALQGVGRLIDPAAPPPSPGRPERTPRPPARTG